jgi:hypothetical protein
MQIFKGIECPRGAVALNLSADAKQGTTGTTAHDFVQNSLAVLCLDFELAAILAYYRDQHAGKEIAGTVGLEEVVVLDNVTICPVAEIVECGLNSASKNLAVWPAEAR